MIPLGDRLKERQYVHNFIEELAKGGCTRENIVDKTIDVLEKVLPKDIFADFPNKRLHVDYWMRDKLDETFGEKKYEFSSETTLAEAMDKVNGEDR